MHYAFNNLVACDVCFGTGFDGTGRTISSRLRTHLKGPRYVDLFDRRGCGIFVCVSAGCHDPAGMVLNHRLADERFS
jgi:hypothetical protein